MNPTTRTAVALATALTCLSAPAARAETTFVAATPANVTRWDGKPFRPAPKGSSLPDVWKVRHFGNSGRILESNADTPGDAPLLVTTIEGLEPNADFLIFAYFWNDGRGWRLKASARTGDIDDNGTPANHGDDFLPSTPRCGFIPGTTGTRTAAPAPLALLTDFRVPPLIAEDNRALHQALLGKFTSSADGTLRVFIDDLAGASEADRVWFEGVGFRPAPDLDPAADEDGDGLINADEKTGGTDPFLADTDGDRHTDSREVAAGSDPLDAASHPPLPGNAVPVAPDGAWTWFNDERAIFHQGSLFCGYVLGDGRYGVTRYDPVSKRSHHMVLSTPDSRQRDDHNNPSLTVLPDGRLLALYAKHLGGARFFQRTSLVPLPSSDKDWGPEIVHDLPANNTYNNTYALGSESGRIYNFHRCINFNPTITISDDAGATWREPVPFIEVGSNNVRPYPRYCSNRSDRIDLIYTDGHPRDIDNSVFHMFYRDGAFHRSDGVLIDSFANLPLDHEGGQRGSVVYRFENRRWGPGDGPDDWIPGGRGWTWDVHYGRDGNPVCVFQVQADEVTGNGWENDRIYYYYARWTGDGWQRRFIAHGGRPLYPSEDDYGGGMAIDPENPEVVYVSSNAADPFDLREISDLPLRKDARYEIWRGVTKDGGLTFAWEQITTDSPADNLRPIVPESHGHDRALVWFHGTYTSYVDFDTEVLALLEKDSGEVDR